MIDLTDDQQKNLELAADAIGDHLGHAWNYSATLEALGAHAKLDRKLFLTHAHFISTIVYALWDALFLKLHHCMDTRRESHGFPCFFSLIRKYLPAERDLLQQLDTDAKMLRCQEAAEKIKRWRNEVVAHHAHYEESFRHFYATNQCRLEDIKPLIEKYQSTLNQYAIEILNLGFRPDDMSRHAKPAVDAIVEQLVRGEAH